MRVVGLVFILLIAAPLFAEEPNFEGCLTHVEKGKYGAVVIKVYRTTDYPLDDKWEYIDKVFIYKKYLKNKGEGLAVGDYFYQPITPNMVEKYKVVVMKKSKYLRGKDEDKDFFSTYCNKHLASK